MKRKLYTRMIIPGYILSSLFLTGCVRGTISETMVQSVSQIDYNEIYTLTEADTDVSMGAAQEVFFEEGQTVFRIENPGDYLLSGSYEGQIQIDAKDQIVHLIMDNVELMSPKGPVIYVQSAAKVVITIPDGSNCIVKDSTDYTEYTDAKSCIYSTADLTINGGGSLQVYGYYNDAIRTKDTLKILDIQLEVQAKDTALRGNDGVVIQSEVLNIQCEGTGIYTEKANKTNRGFVDMVNSTVNIIAGEYGISASENVYIRNCTAHITGIVQDIACQGQQYIEEGCLE